MAHSFAHNYAVNTFVTLDQALARTEIDECTGRGVPALQQQQNSNPSQPASRMDDQSEWRTLRSLARMAAYAEEEWPQAHPRRCVTICDTSC